MVTATEKQASVAPGPKGLPIVGSAIPLLRDILGTTLRGMHQYGDVVRYVAGPPGPMRVIAYGIAHPDLVQHVLATGASHYSKQDAAYIELRHLVGNGLLTSEGETWRRQKRMVQPLFTHKRVGDYVGMMADEAALVAGQWADAARRGEAVDLHGEMSRVSLRVVGRALFGGDTDDILHAFKDNVPYLSRRAFVRSITPVRIPETWPLPGNRKAARAQAEVNSAVDGLIARRRAAPAGGQDMLGLLLEAQDPEGGIGLDDGEVRDQTLIFLAAGQETTATSMTFALHLLGLHPDIQARVQKEVDEVLGDRPPVLEDLPALEWTTMAVKEAMRLFPAAYAIPRLVEETDELNGYTITPGSMAVVSPYVTHRHPRFWDDPERYKPERFTPEQEKARHRYAYFPFGGGPRACIGQYFSMLEAVIVTAVLARAFRFTSPTGEVPLVPGITLRPKRAMPCGITAR
jgi:cytochrome P450